MTSNSIINLTPGIVVSNAIDSQNNIYLQDSVIQEDGKILEAGGLNNKWALFRYNPDGTLDTSFSSDGFDALRNELGYCDYIALQSDSKILAAGTMSDGTPNGEQSVLARYNTDGSLDNSFGVNGIYQLPSSSYFNNLEVQGDGKILFAITNNSWNGSVYTGTGYLARLNTNGSLDTSFGVNGKIALTANYSSHSFFVPQSDGKILFASEHSQGNIGITRYNSNGSLDAGFGSNGITTTVISDSYGDIVDAMAFQNDGKILVNTNSYGLSGDFLLRYNKNGTLDTSFDLDGKVSIDFPNSQGCYVSAIKILSNGKIIIAGSAYNYDNSNTGGFALACYNADGSMDTSFGSQGKVINYFGVGVNASVDSIKIATDGSILVIGSAFDATLGSYSYYHVLARYTSNGTLDSTYSQSFSPNNSSNIIGTLAGELLYGFTGDDTINGVGGDDSIDGGAGNDTLNGGAGNDTYNIYDGTGGSDVIIDSSGIDTVNWYRHHDGQGHFDINVSRGGANDADLVVTASQYGVVKQTTTIVGQFSSNTPVIETIVKNPDDNPDIYSFINSLNGTINNDFVVGTNSNDILNGDDGQDLLFGGNGNDTLNGGDRGDKLYGGLGNDSLVGGGGDDQLSSGYGNDTLVGGTGDDEYELYPQKGSSTSGSNTIEESQNEGNDWIYISDAYNVDMTRSNNGKDLVISAYQNGVFVGVNTVVNQYSVANSVAVENYSLWLDGSDKTWAFINSFNGNFTQTVNELIVGSATDDTLNGYGGNDLLFGGAGVDVLNGGLGDDDLNGGKDIDIAVFQGMKSEYIKTRNTNGTWTITDTVINRDGSDKLTSIEKIQFSDQVYILPDTPISTVLSLSSYDGASNIAVGTNIIVTFSEAIRRGAGNIGIHSGSATGNLIASYDVATSSNLSINGSTLTINPSADLAYSTNYFVTFDSGSIKDLAGNGVADINTYDFTTSTKNNTTTSTQTLDDIASVGVSPDNSTLLIKFSSGELMSVPNTSGNGSVSLNGTTFSTSAITQHTTPQAVFKSLTGGTIDYLLPDLFSGSPSLNLKYQHIDTTPNAVVVGSTDNDFIKVADTHSSGKAVDGGGGSDVIDGGVGSTFVTGGAGHHGDTFFLDGRAPGVSWSTITDFQLGSDQATIWGFVKGVSSVDTTFSTPNNEGAGGIYNGLTLHFKNLLADGLASGTNADLNSITLSGHTLADIGVSSLQDLNNKINNAQTANSLGQYVVNEHIIIGQTQDVLGAHSYLFLH